MKTIRIYQLKRENIEAFGFLGYDESKRMNGREVEKADYDMLYETALPMEGLNEAHLDEVFEIFNIDRPDDFKGHSLSVSDVVEMDGEFWYCDSFGWRLLKW